MGISEINSKQTQPSLITHTSTNSVPSKTSFYARKAFMVTFVPFFVLLASIAGSTLTLGTPQICRLISRKNKSEVQQKIEERRKEYLLAITPQFSHMDNETLTNEFTQLGLKPDQVAPFVKNVLEIYQGIPTLSMERLYKKLQKLFSDPLFLEIIHSAPNATAVRFLTQVAIQFRLAPMKDIMVEYGQKKIGQVEDPTLDKVASVVANKTQETSFNQNRWYHLLFWGISHPGAWYHALETVFLPESYDSNESNATYEIDRTNYVNKRGETVTARWIAGPTPFNDPVYAKAFLKDRHELRFNIMDTSKKGEYKMIKRMQEKADNSNGHLQHVIWGFDTKKKRGFLDANNIDDLLKGYEKTLMRDSRKTGSLSQDNGILIPEGLLSDSQIQKGCEIAKSLVTKLYGNKKLSKVDKMAILVTVDTMLALGILIQYLEKSKTSDVTIAVACKQCFDRGPVYLAALQLFYRTLSSDKLFSDIEFYQLAGLPLFRSPLNEDRAPLHERMQVYQQVMQMIGDKVDVLAEHTKAFRDYLTQQ